MMFCMTGVEVMAYLISSHRVGPGLNQGNNARAETLDEAKLLAKKLIGDGCTKVDIFDAANPTGPPAITDAQLRAEM